MHEIGGWMKEDNNERATASSKIFSVRRQSHVGGLLRTIKIRERSRKVKRLWWILSN